MCAYHFENITWNRVKMHLVCYPFWIDLNFRIEVRSPSNGSATSFNSISIFNFNKYNGKLRFKVDAFTRKLRPKLFIYYWHNISLALEKKSEYRVPVHMTLWTRSWRPCLSIFFINRRHFAAKFIHDIIHLRLYSCSEAQIHNWRTFIGRIHLSLRGNRKHRPW